MRFELNLLEVCSKLHMSRTGAGPTLSEPEANRLLNNLRKEIATWKDFKHETEEYDTAVYNLIVAVLKEYEHI